MTDDLISRQAAIDAIDETNWYHQNENKDMVSGANSAEHQPWFKSDDVYSALKSLPSAPHWIPVTERLPEKFYERVLICGKRGGIAIANYRNILPGVSPFWVQGNKTMEAVAWMPLPEPYERSEE